MPAHQNPDFVYLDTDGGALMHGYVFLFSAMGHPTNILNRISHHPVVYYEDKTRVFFRPELPVDGDHDRAV